MSIAKSVVESERFNLNVYRGKQSKIDIREINRVVGANKPDVMILRFPIEEQFELYKLRSTGYEVIFADTLVYYEKSLDAPSPPLRNDISARIDDRKDVEACRKMVNDIFKGYKNHYFSNPLFKKEDILAGYTEWALNHFSDPSKDMHIYINAQNERVGFAACARHNEEVCEGVLYGIVDAFGGRGMYTDFISSTARHYYKSGFKKMRVSTQVGNYAVQRAWVKNGFKLSEAFITVHLVKPGLIIA